ncbi:MAG: nucleotidyltransferase domain-containing protein [Nanoarchaeota archaeon]|nr:nucleotidyltransferase domain-containing protein [Nanoarchaeota archaeon]
MALTEKEKNILLLLFKDFSSRYNARMISKLVGMTPRGALKSLKNLEKQHFVTATAFGRAILFRVDFNTLTRKNIELLLLEEAEMKHKRWVEEFKGFNEADIIILFGSALKKDKPYNDIDLLIVVSKEQYGSLKKKIEQKNEILPKMVHPVFQTLKDLKENLASRDKIVFDALKTGIVLKGQNKAVEAIADAAGV